MLQRRDRRDFPPLRDPITVSMDEGPQLAPYRSRVIDTGPYPHLCGWWPTPLKMPLKGSFCHLAIVFATVLPFFNSRQSQYSQGFPGVFATFATFAIPPIYIYSLRKKEGPLEHQRPFPI